MKLRMMLALGACLALAACGDDEETEPSADTGTEADTGMQTDTTTEDAGMEPDTAEEPDTTVEEDTDPVEPDPPSCEEGGVGVLSIAGAVTDADGAIEGGKAQLCLRTAPAGTLLCLRPADSAADGTFEVGLPSNAQCLEEATMRALLPNTTYSTTYCEIPLEVGSDFVIQSPFPFQLFDTDAPTSLPELGDETASRTIVFADGLEVDIVPERMERTNETYPELRAARVDPSEEALCFLEEGERPDGLWTFNPEVNVDGVGDLRIPNDDGLEPGTEVNIYILGGLGTTVDDEEIKEAEWRMVGTGAVNDDGSFIEAPGTLHAFNWLGYSVVE